MKSSSVRTHICTYKRMYVCMYACMCMYYVCMYVFVTYVCVSFYNYIYIYLNFVFPLDRVHKCSFHCLCKS